MSKGYKAWINFYKDDRKLIHQIANNIGLKTQSIGNGQNRYLTIGKKRSPHDILKRVVANSGQYGKYKLLKKWLILIYLNLFGFCLNKVIFEKQIEIFFIF
jgi:hypothetical protein